MTILALKSYPIAKVVLVIRRILIASMAYMNPKHLKKIFRKLPFHAVVIVKVIIDMKNKNLTNEIDTAPNLPSASAFVQQQCHQFR